MGPIPNTTNPPIRKPPTQKPIPNTANPPTRKPIPNTSNPPTRKPIPNAANLPTQRPIPNSMTNQIAVPSNLKITKVGGTTEETVARNTPMTGNPKVKNIPIKKVPENMTRGEKRAAMDGVEEVVANVQKKTKDEDAKEKVPCGKCGKNLTKKQMEGNSKHRCKGKE